MQVHVQQQELYVYGTDLWKSIDGGRDFTLQKKLFGGDMFHEFDSTLGGAFMLRTATQRIYYGRAGSDDLLLVSSLNVDPHGADSFNALYFDEVGDASVIKVPRVRDTSLYANPTLYPVGFLGDSSGALREDLGISRLSLPVASVTAVADDSFPGVLVPIPRGESRWWMWIYDMDSLGAVNGVTWEPWHILKRIAQTNLWIGESGDCVIDEINAQKTVASCLTSTDFGKISSSESIAVVNGLQVAGLNSTFWIGAVAPKLQDWTPVVQGNVVITLVAPQGSNNVTGSWARSDVGRTIVVNGGAIVITSLASATTANGLTVWPPTSGTDGNGVLTVATGTWNLYDFRHWIDETQTFAQTVNVQAVGTGSTGGLALCHLSAGSMKMSSKHIGMIFDDHSGFGIIQRIISETNFEISILSSISVGVKASGTWNIYPSSRDFDFSSSANAPSSQFRRRPWALRADHCRWDSLETSTAASVVYLGYLENVTIAATLRMKRDWASTNELSWASRMSFSVTNPTLHDTQQIHLSGDNADVESGINMTIVDAGIMGQNILSIRPVSYSLTCEDSTPTIWLFSRCPPTRSIRIEQVLDVQTFLYGAATLVYDVPLVESLPFNYRPPSTEGKSVPTTEHIYNAAPDKPRYNDRYWASRTTGKLKQCLNAQSRFACNCTDAQRSSEFVADSDCIDKAIRVLYSQVYVPSLFVHEHGKEPVALSHTFRLTELNGREDYCISSADDCSDVTSLRSALLEPGFDNITWTGSELYHFKVSADFHYCTLETEMQVYVILAPTATLVEQSAMATAAVVFLIWLLVTYLYHSYKEGQGW
ncbi:hypothetical protein M427DRAFT_449604 [Gonapodya prolifera JEL478]|uniref:Cation channel sperm-associated protein subunit beta C-terminal domain-containing protein n=1 Tax=Gonapodya prolifera (strain JEL478) TaxID=1344416 RepID=A0A139ASD7_GONPJ|nr:hypothetical protein M427DRAFT_449604 [Gonapodya prolifera JEL478]|eukprot:KXS19395.1 hypothetical protein M427DRAFT_449604 [Gonapodya prolifera JEL478]